MTPTGAIKILLIDDDEDDRDFFKIAAGESSHDISCETAPGCLEGLKLLAERKFSPDFIFLDLNMPGTDGRYCLCELKKNLNTVNIPVVIFSTSSEHKDMIETKSLGATDFMSKPSSITQLTNQINNLINQFKNSNK